MGAAVSALCGMRGGWWVSGLLRSRGDFSPPLKYRLNLSRRPFALHSEVQGMTIAGEYLIRAFNMRKHKGHTNKPEGRKRVYLL